MQTVRRTVGHALKPLWHHAGFARLARWAAGRRGAILRYHSVTADESVTLAYLDQGLMVTRNAFRAQLRYLRRFYTVMSLEAIVDALHRGASLPPGAVAITFDDGYRDNYTEAYPLLRAEGMTATFYVTTGCLDGGPPLWTAKLRYMVRQTTCRSVILPPPFGGTATIAGPADRQALFTRLIVGLKNIPSVRRRELIEELAAALAVTDFSALDDIMMTWDHVRELSRNGMTIGAHTVSHPNLPNTPSREATAEIAGSRDMIAAAIGAPAVHFSYPNGRGSAHVTEEIRTLVQRLGFRSAVTSVPGCVRTGADPWALRRVGVYNRHRHMPSFSLDVERARLQPEA